MAVPCCQTVAKQLIGEGVGGHADARNMHASKWHGDFRIASSHPTLREPFDSFKLSPQSYTERVPYGLPAVCRGNLYYRVYM